MIDSFGAREAAALADGVAAELGAYGVDGGLDALAAKGVGIDQIDGIRRCRRRQGRDTDADETVGAAARLVLDQRCRRPVDGLRQLGRCGEAEAARQQPEAPGL